MKLTLVITIVLPPRIPFLSFLLQVRPRTILANGAQADKTRNQLSVGKKNFQKIVKIQNLQTLT